MTAGDESGVRNAFLHRLLDDRERGSVLDLAGYQALFPGAEAAIAAEYAAVTGADAGPVAGTTTDELPQIGPYRLLGRIGQGSFGLVYRAEDTRLHRTVALKVLARAGLATDREREQFEREAAIASRLDHPGICTVYEIARHGLWTCIAMRFVPGETLAARLSRSRDGLPVAEVLPLVEKTAAALHAAHCAGVVHRDVKPGNIMVTTDDEPVVVDFGLARDLGGATGHASLTADHVGSPSYMAPEQLDPARGAIDARTDVWALGVVLYECLAGARPFEAATQSALFDAILRSEPRPLRARAPQVSADLAVVVATAMAKEPGLRYASAQALAADLARVRRGEPIAARPIGLVGSLVRWIRRNPLVASLLAAVLLALGSGLVVAAALWQRAAANLRDWERLADGRKLAQLQKAADTDLVRAIPEMVPAFDAWLAAAAELLSRKPDHERALAALRARAKPWSATTAVLEEQRDDQLKRDRAAVEARDVFLKQHLAAFDLDPPPPERRAAMRAQLLRAIADNAAVLAAMTKAIDERTCYEFDDLRDQLQHDEIRDLVLGLRWLSGEIGERTTTVAAMQKRRDTALTLRQRTIDDHRDAWNAAAARVLADPAYRGLRLVPQLGLVPLGPDPASKLEEFAAPETGELPQRDATGRIAVTPEMAVVFVLLPPGRAVVGGQADDPARPGYDPSAISDEAPVREVEITARFLSKYEMTQGQWRFAFDYNPSTYSRGNRESETVFIDFDHPVETVNWHDAVKQLARLGWWLPQEAVWEYACRAGTTTPWWCDRAELSGCANLADQRFHASDPRGWPSEDWDDGRSLHAPVGSYRANPFGLHDMIGNVAEWCYDQYRPYDAGNTTFAPPPNVVYIGERVARGGSFLSPARAARSAARDRYDESIRTFVIGVRPMRALTTE